MKDFTSLEHLDDATIEDLLTTARALEREPRNDGLRGRVLGLLFLNPSLRTLASCQAAMVQLGGGSFVIQPGQGSWALETELGVTMNGVAAEHIREAVPVLEQYSDALGVRCFAKGESLAEDLTEPTLGAILDVARGPVLNLESAMDHPCQALADWKTLDDLEVPRSSGRLVLSWAWHPKALPLAVPAATVRMGLRRGMDVTVLRPEGFGFPTALRNEAQAIAARGGGHFTETDDRAAALEGAHVVYGKSWGSPDAYGDPEREAALRAPLEDWCIREDWFSTAQNDASFLHCLPVRRNVVVADEVLDGPRSRVVQQAGNRLHAQKAVLARLLGGVKNSPVSKGRV